MVITFTCLQPSRPLSSINLRFAEIPAGPPGSGSDHCAGRYPAAMSKANIYLLIGAVGVMVAAIVTAIVLVWLDWPSNGDWAEAGVRGDFWGGHISPAASLVAALLFVIAILLQYQELKLQREELAATRQEMAAARKVHERQAEALNLQADMLKRQGTASERSAIVSNIIEMIRYRADLQINKFARHDVARNFLRSSEGYLRALLLSPLINNDDRTLLEKAARLSSSSG